MGLGVGVEGLGFRFQGYYSGGFWIYGQMLHEATDPIPVLETLFLGIKNNPGTLDLIPRYHNPCPGIELEF